ncbi:MAG: hypothetical protein L0Z51_06910 [Candidatus Latescibacteria bacterium]|nr:hypothetical protein [Candidatus Latescibacterota bacterium]
MVDTSGVGPWVLHSDFDFYRVTAEDQSSPGDLNGADFDCGQNFDDDNGDGLRDNIIGHNYTEPFACLMEAALVCPDCEEPTYEAAFWQGMPHNWVLEWQVAPDVPAGWSLHPDGPYETHGLRVASLAAASLAGNNIVGVGFGARIYVMREDYGTLFRESSMVAHAATICDVLNEHRDRGAYKVVWDGQNAAGQTVPSGVYFYRLTTAWFTDTKKMTILK